MNNIFDLIFFVIGIIIAFAMKDKFTTNDEVIEDIKKEFIKIRIERIEDMYYAWKENDFICQSKNVDDVLDHVKQKFPNTIFTFTSDRNLEEWLQSKKI